MGSCLKYHAIMEILLGQTNPLAYFDKELILAGKGCMVGAYCEWAHASTIRLGWKLWWDKQTHQIFYTDLIMAVKGFIVGAHSEWARASNNRL
jgi:hypothetical protein